MKRSALSPSRAKDFQQCPLLFRYRTVDRLPEPASAAATKGTLVHSVLERLYDAPPAERTADYAVGLLPQAWEDLRQRDKRVEQLFDNPSELSQWLAEARSLIERYFLMERPTHLAPAGRERFIEVEVADGLLLRGIIDRVDMSTSGAMRIVDYKTGKSPRPQYTEDALFQMRFYALMVWRLTGTIPARLQLLYLADGNRLTLDPQESELVELEQRLRHLWEQIEHAARERYFPPRRTALCGWCSFQNFCPEFGNDVLPIPPQSIERLLSARMPGTQSGQSHASEVS